MRQQIYINFVDSQHFNAAVSKVGQETTYDAQQAPYDDTSDASSLGGHNRNLGCSEDRRSVTADVARSLHRQVQGS